MRKWEWRGALPIAGVAALAVGLAVLGAVGLKLFFSSQGVADPWVVAVSSSSSLVLVAVTAVYVVFTGNLVRLQSEANQRILRHEADALVRKSMGYMFPAQRQAAQLMARYPLSSSSPVAYKIDTYLEQFRETTEAFRSTALQLPAELIEDTMRTVYKMTMASLCCQITENLILISTNKHLRQIVRQSQEDGAEIKQSFAPTSDSESANWEQVRTLFYRSEGSRGRLADERGKLPEWSDMESGRLVSEAFESIMALEKKYQQWLSR